MDNYLYRILLLLSFTLFTSQNLFSNAHIFVLHHFEDQRFQDSTVKIERLEENINYLLENKYKIVSLEELVSKIEKKEKIPDKWVVFTIDDGYKSFYEHGLEVFKKHKLPFTLFLFVQAIDKNYSEFINWKQVKEISKYGTIAFHSYEHNHLTKMSHIDILKDTQTGIQILRHQIENFSEFYSYPYGEFNAKTQDIIQKFGFRAIFNQNIGVVSDESDIFNLNRIPLLGNYKLDEILKIDHLKTEWIYPSVFPANNKLEKIEVKLPKKKNITEVEFYISGTKKWHKAEIKNSTLEFYFKKPVDLSKKNKFRIFIRTLDNLWSSQLFIK
jgi:peptidoglycan/xylan/chitin deacetylase (PgdA/CDA1 family)